MARPEDILAILVDRLGGDVTIADHELAADAIELQAYKSDTEFALRFRTRRRPEQIDGEIVAPALESTAEREPWT